MRRAAGGKRRDATEPAITEALRGLGCTIRYVSGAGLPDLIVTAPGPSKRIVLLEVKSAKGTRTAAQAEIDWPIVRTPEEAIAAVFG